MNGSSIEYNPGEFRLSDFKELFTSLRSEQYPREYRILVDGYGMAVFNNDTEKIAYYQRLHRVEKITSYRNLITEFGSEMAKVVAILIKKSNAYGDSKVFKFHQYGSTYKSFGEGELESINLYVYLRDDNSFDIRLRCDEDYAPKPFFDSFIRKGVSYKSILNHLSYFERKLKEGIL